MAVSSRRDNPIYESVSVRQRGAWDFASYYESLCVLQDTCPLPMVKTSLGCNALDLNADRIRFEDWSPIINSIKINKSLEFIAIRSYYDPQPDDIPATRYPILKSSRKVPCIRNGDVLRRLCCALRECLKTTSNLKVLELQGLPLTASDMQALSIGFSDNTTLTCLSFEFCGVGDECVEILCNGLKQAVSIWYLDLTCCDVTALGAESLAKLVVFQSSLRHAEAWQDSLRYRRPNLDMLMGLRRIVLNGNTLLGDDGAIHFAEALKDDLWLKALDLQKCGITTDGARALHEVLKFSVTMVVCDIRKNAFIEKEMIRAVTEQCLINCQGRDAEYPWLKMKSSENPDIEKLRQKTTPRPSATQRPRKSCRKKGRRTASVNTAASENKVTDVPCEAGFPFHTALRAGRHKAYPPEQDAQIYAPERDEITREYHAMSQSHRTDDSGASSDRNSFQSPSGKRASPSKNEGQDLRSVQIELQKTKIKLERETESRRRLDQRMIDLELENSRLRRELLNQKKKKSSGLSDEQAQILDSVEETFTKFAKFLDLLRQAGFSELADLAGLDSSDFGTAALGGGNLRKPQKNDGNEPKTSQVGEGDAQWSKVCTSGLETKQDEVGGADSPPPPPKPAPRANPACGDAQPGDFQPRTTESLMEEVERLTRESKISRDEAALELDDYHEETQGQLNSEAADYRSIDIQDILNEADDDDATPSPMPISIVSENGGLANSKSIDD